MKLLRFFLVIHIILSLLLIVLILYGTEIFAALGWDVPWDEMVNAASEKLHEAYVATAAAVRSASIRAAKWLANVTGTVSGALSAWVQSTQA